ncbi:MAG TPA: DsbA family protein [Alphaproteobacteria bacterium]|nr:DsbA family protein [Alphaproteobacteria bacterium]
MRKILIALLIVAAAAIAVVAYREWQPGSKTAATPAGGQASEAKPFTVTADDRVLGSPDAPVTVIEYASMTCPHCAHFDVEILPQIKSTLIDSGKARLVFRDFPLDGLALRGAMLVRCVGNDRAFGMIDLLFSRQAQWAGAQDPIAALGTIAAQAGMSGDDFKACVENQTVLNAVVQSRTDAENTYGINSTPSFLINGQLVVGAYEAPEFIKMVEAAAAGAPAAPTSSSPSTPAR